MTDIDFMIVDSKTWCWSHEEAWVEDSALVVRAAVMFKPNQIFEINNEKMIFFTNLH